MNLSSSYTIDHERRVKELESERDDYKARALMYERTNAEQSAMLNKVIAQRDELLAALIHIQQVACSGSPELGIATAAIAKAQP